MTQTIEQKIQQMELDTVKAVTEMRADIKTLTTEVKRLNDTIIRMTQNYVTREDHDRDIRSLTEDLKEAKQAGKVRALLYSVLTAIIVGVTTFEVMRILQ